MILIVILIKLQLVEVVLLVIIFLVLKKNECDHARGTLAEQHGRNPRETQTHITCGTRAYY